jgi:NADP-dependent 3-hydroxy acid dehydrogenase YdfG
MSERAFAGQTAVVSGASGAIGGAVARELARQGARLLLLGRDAERLERLAAAVAEQGGDARCLAGDLAAAASADGDAWSRLERALAELVGVDLLINTMGEWSAATLGASPIEEIDRVLGVNFRSPLLLTRLCLPALLERRGQVVFVNSSAGARAGGTSGAYAAAKQALRAAADGLRDEVNARGVRVLTIFPGRTAGAMQQEVCRHLGQAYEPERMLQPGDVAAAIVDALRLPRTAELTELHLRPMRPPTG